MSHATLERLGLDLPLLPLTAVGSFPKPPELVAARAALARGEIDAVRLDDEARRATEYWIRVQERLEFDVLVDGEMYRGDMVAYFAKRLDGFAAGGLVRTYGNRYYRKPVIAGDVRWNEPITLDWWRYAQSLTPRPVKAIITGPYTMMDWSFLEHYDDRRAACLALAQELRHELDALVEAGTRVVQIDEPALSARPDELDLAAEALEVLTGGLAAYLILHVCYGAFDTIYPGLLRLPVDNFDFAVSHSSTDVLKLFERTPFTKDLSLGVIDVHSHETTPRSEVAARIRRGTHILSPTHLWIGPDCGLKTRTVEEAEEKLEQMAAATREVRAELADHAREETR